MGTVLLVHSYSYFDAHVDPDGSFVHSGPMSGDGYHYAAPDGTGYSRHWWYHRDGSPTGRVEHHVSGPVVDDLTVINHVDRTYSLHQNPYPAPRPQILDLASSPAAVREALLAGRVAQQGTTTVDGTPAIALSIPEAACTHLALYVDERTYQPLRTVVVLDGNPTGTHVSDRVPATPDNIAKATQHHPAPAGYTKVDWAG